MPLVPLDLLRYYLAFVSTSREEFKKMKVELALERIRRALGVEKDSDVAEILGYSSTGTISGWKARGFIPEGPLAKISLISGKPIDWLSGESDDAGADLDSLTYQGVGLNLSERAIDFALRFDELPEEKKKYIEAMIRAEYIKLKSKRPTSFKKD